MDDAPLALLDKKFADGEFGYVDHMLIIRHGQVVYEKSYQHDYKAISSDLASPAGMYNYYDPEWHPYYKNTSLHSMQSATKSIASVAIGIAIARGELSGAEAEIKDFFLDYREHGFDETKQQIRLKDLLTMQAGIQWDEGSYPYTDLRNSCGQMERSDDWIKYVAGQPMTHEPGTEFRYNSGASQMLSQIIRQATGEYIDDYLERHLFGPLGIEYFWKRTPTGLPDTEGGLYLTPRGLAKIGHLYLNDGIWKGKRILPEGWVRESVQPHVTDIVSRGNRYRYGYQWWSMAHPEPDRPDIYAARGYGGQFLYVSPAEELIAVFTGWNIYDEFEILPPSVLHDYVLTSIVE